VVALDSSVLLRALVGDGDELVKKARAIIADAKPSSLHVDRIILEEVGYVLRSYYGFEKAKIVRWLHSVIADERFYVPDRELVALTVDIFEHEQPLSFEDSWLLALKRFGTVTAVETFDEALVKRA
jgi:predicted nucleic acid-binding protein